MLKDHINQCLLWHEQRGKALFKQSPEDFVVDEILDWQFKGEGEHIFLYVEKTNCNTVWVAKQLARFYGVPPRDVGYSGLKDRHAVTRQYFSVRLPGVKPHSYDIPTHDEYRVVSHMLHDKKLKRGNHPFNRFTIRLHQVEADADIIQTRLAFIQQHGCPNFFDSQRFGHDGNNLTQALAWINGDISPRKRNEKSLLLSAIRSSFFNQQLAQRIGNDTWNQIITGDTVLLDGSNSHFLAEQIDDTLSQRAAEMDIHPAGILIGEHDVSALNTDIDKAMLEKFLRQEHMQSAYRPLRLHVRDLTWEILDGDNTQSSWQISMKLPSGAYASGVIRQLFDI